MDKEQTLTAFFESFGWPAYDENSVPKEATMPYITYEVATDRIGRTVYLSAALWERSTSWANITHKADEIARTLGYGGLNIPFDNGSLRITMGSPFSQRAADDDDTIRRILLNLTAEYITEH